MSSPDITVAEGTPRIGLAWFSAVLLSLVYLLAYVDRFVITLFIESIKRDLALSDTEISLLVGLAFLLFYSTMAIPIARHGDRHARVPLLVWSVVVFSSMTTLTGFARSFWVMFLARFGTAAGEAGVGPVGFSLLSDLFPTEKLGRAVAVFLVGATSGAGTAMLFGGAVAHAVGESGRIELPLLGEVQTWQLAYLVLGVGGFLFAGLLALLLREPPRRDLRETDAHGWKALGRHIGTHRAAYLPILLAYILSGIGNSAMMTWFATYLIRVHGMNPSETGYSLGVALLLAGTGGTVVAGVLIDWLRARGVQGAPLLITIFAVTIAGLLLLASLTTSQAMPAIVLFGCGYFFMLMPTTTINVATQIITPNQFRASIGALCMMLINIFGAIPGTTLVALITDRAFADPLRIGTSMMIVAGTSLSLSALLFWWAHNHCRREFPAL